jgi:hypothetical protein
MAISADSQPHFTTIAHFIATLDREITKIFRDVLLVCDEAGLIGKEMFAVDGGSCRATRARSGAGARRSTARRSRKWSAPCGT